MNYSEWLSIKNLNYNAYCLYLIGKYGHPSYPYFTTSGSRCTSNSRTSDGLFIHHIGENKYVQLSTFKYAKLAPYELQLPEHLLYCDYLEHLWLHILIYVEYGYPYGCGGVRNYLLPELLRLYSKKEINIPRYKKVCFDKVKDDYYCFGHLVYHWRQIWIESNVGGD